MTDPQDDRECEECGVEFNGKRSVCYRCRRELDDLLADYIREQTKDEGGRF